ncbi:NUDIX hydrolase [Actinoallomurus iriomotensis]|uniref:DNA mismatch repair protein MutT n=1 Tax=Actinoallomurus iriomotensis TaxID=478107 RepID=A0A9W6S8J7_9ACTN|nr:NUDIX domain-containing protein [Actinoallomurus iriomotensis]GLY87737.1 DNA mismatch repair protein MutT [Actinoallomurus iriomotensis]
MSPPKIRHAARAIILDEEDRVLLCRFTTPDVVWTAPGGGIESGESALAALRRELLEEVGLALAADPPHVWRQRVESPGFAPRYDGVLNDYFLVRTESFAPRGTLSDAELAAENISGLRWWRPQDIAAYRGPDLFSPRDLATPLAALIAHGVPSRVVELGL